MQYIKLQQEAHRLLKQKADNATYDRDRDNFLCIRRRSLATPFDREEDVVSFLIDELSEYVWA